MMNLRPQLAPRVEQRLGLALTPQMRQRIEMLSMTLTDLAELTTQEMAENPLLEETDPREPAEGLTVTDDLLPEAAGEGDFGLVNDEAADASPAAAELEAAADSPAEDAADEPSEAVDPFAEIDFGAMFENYLDPGYRAQGEYEEREEYALENRLKRDLTLYEHLQSQIILLHLSEEMRAAAEAIAASLDERGFLADSCEEIAAIGGWTLETVEAARHLVQRLDPAGCASYDTRECFITQLEQQGHGNRLAARLVRDYLDRLAPFRWPDLAKLLGVSCEAIAEEVALIRQLDPFPGRRFARIGEGLLNGAQLIQPEIFIEKVGDAYVIRFNDDGLPQLRINAKYRRILENPAASREERDYVRDRLRAAIDLMRNIDYRRRTIYRICEAIVERQRDFLDHGPARIKPMMLKDIAERVGLHLSTVSRVVNGKYVQTPLGIIELRRFFTEGLINDDGEAVSTDVIKLRIKRLIAEEDPREPLTDDEIARILAREGQKLSRRTVAKYRDQMHIPGSRERRAGMG
ncbi:MAG: RNA polymerase sigma-54 factor [Chloracidobacterium sp. CP2_5A]|nr:MAG: RNA polymerase sigma-54 factor [Chloracidobacterium sp. CP2_5A]